MTADLPTPPEIRCSCYDLSAKTTFVHCSVHGKMRWPEDEGDADINAEEQRDRDRWAEMEPIIRRESAIKNVLLYGDTGPLQKNIFNPPEEAVSEFSNQDLEDIVAMTGVGSDGEELIVSRATQELAKRLLEARRELACLSQLAVIVSANDWPIGRHPEWPQDVAWLAHFIDSTVTLLRSQQPDPLASLLDALKAYAADPREMTAYHFTQTEARLLTAYIDTLELNQGL